MCTVGERTVALTMIACCSITQTPTGQSKVWRWHARKMDVIYFKRIWIHCYWAGYTVYELTSDIMASSYESGLRIKCEKRPWMPNGDVVPCLKSQKVDSLQWRHNGRDIVSNHQPHDCLLNRLFRRRSKKTPKLRVTGLCAGNSPGTGEFPAQMASYAENVSIWWRHHVNIAAFGHME